MKKFIYFSFCMVISIVVYAQGNIRQELLTSSVMLSSALQKGEIQKTQIEDLILAGKIAPDVVHFILEQKELGIILSEEQISKSEELYYGNLAIEFFNDPSKFENNEKPKYEPNNIEDNNPDITFLEKNISGNSQFGRAVSNAGDVNGDTYDDVIVATQQYDSDRGRAYIFYGGTAMDNAPDVILIGENTGDKFGCSVAGAGDVNGDGYDDVIVGAYQYNSSTGRAYIFYGGSSMNNVADVIFDGEGTSNVFGFSVSSAGNVNRDDYADVVIGAYGYSNSTGRAYVFLGSENMGNSPFITMTGVATNNFFGYSVSNARDVNNDGYTDVIIGAPGNNSNTGAAYIFYGDASMDNTADVTMNVGTSGDFFGWSVSGAGNVNGDNYDAVIVGAVGYNSYQGRAYIFLGGDPMNDGVDVTLTGNSVGDNFGFSVSSGFFNNDTYSDVIVGAYGATNNKGDGYIFYGGSTMNNELDMRLTIPDVPDNFYFGYSVSKAGDINNDGKDEIIVGAYGYDQNTGAAYIYYGGVDLNENWDILLIGEGYSNNFGCSVAYAGDVNNDGFGDIIVGAQNYNNAKGRAYIYYGGTNMNNTADVILTGENNNSRFGLSVAYAGDVNNDNYNDVIVGAPYYNLKGRAYIFYGGASMDNTPDIILNGENDNDRFGASLSYGGDINKDGYDDIIIGAYGYDIQKGKVYIFYGGSPMDTSPDITMTGESGSNRFGFSVANAGDLNKDGNDDYIIGAYGYSNSKGRAYIFYGGPSMDTTPDVTMTGEADGNNFGHSVSGAGDVNKDGYYDVIVGAPYNVSNRGRVYIFYGGASMDNTADVTINGEGLQNYFGYSVAGAGDVNKDGYDDVIVGAYKYNDTGRVYIFYGGSSMDENADVILTGENTGDQFGFFVSSAKDVNGDDISDILVGAQSNDDVELNGGKVYLYFGVLETLSLQLKVFLQGAYR